MADGFRVDGFRVDGSWMLSVFVTDLQVEKRIRVKGDMHVGGVMFKLVEDLGEYRQAMLEHVTGSNVALHCQSG